MEVDILILTIFRGSKITSVEDKTKLDLLRADVDALRKEEAEVEEQTRQAQQTLKNLLENPSLSKYAFVSYDDVRNLSSFAGQTLIGIKAPAGTKLEVPDPDEVRYNYSYIKRECQMESVDIKFG